MGCWPEVHLLPGCSWTLLELLRDSGGIWNPDSSLAKQNIDARGCLLIIINVPFAQIYLVFPGKGVGNLEPVGT